MNCSRAMRRAGSIVNGCVLGRRIPLNVMLSVTNRCTSQCSYCRISHRNQQELTRGQIFALIDQIARLGCLRLGLWGGEPLIREDIGDIIGHAKSAGLWVSLDTNGDLLPQALDRILRLDHLLISFDGPARLHDAHRGPGAYEKVMKAMDAVRGRVPFWTITVLTKLNLGGIDFVLDTARARGFLASFQLLHHNEHLAHPDAIGMIPEASDLRKALRKIIEAKKKGAPVASSFSYLRHLLAWPDYRMTRSPKRLAGARCHAGRLYCNVDTDGLIYPCSLLIGKVPALNSVRYGFHDAFAALAQTDCRSCVAACYTEYNYLGSLHAPTVFEWMRGFAATRKALSR